ncbi:50S ribosomal protein L15 [Candidatus Roizmanbacteria bacterium]|nr:50S ribosomal protein L15 [Candidatus Roizmanbacteria bacterium]
MANLTQYLKKIVIGRKKRLGRGPGSGKGAKSTRGTTRHQKAREDIPLAFEGGQNKLIKRFPLLRGKGKNKSIKLPTLVVHTEQLNAFEDGAVINKKTLAEKGWVKENDQRTIKIVTRGELQKKVVVELPISASARKMVEDRGGQVKTI